MNILEAIILGIVEGITEFLPISSTGHLILASKYLQIPQTEFVKSFEVAVQVGAIAAVIFLYWRDFLKLEVIKRLLVAFIPTGIIGLIFYKLVKQYLLGNDIIVLWSLLLGGIFLIIFEYYFREKQNPTTSVDMISYRQSLLIGLFQAIAIVPGVSRAAATIIGGLLLGINRKAIVEFSFLLAVPTMIAATGLDLFQSYRNFSSEIFNILGIGLVTAFIIAILAIKYFLKYIQNHDFKSFGVYRILIAIIFWIFVL